MSSAIWTPKRTDEDDMESVWSGESHTTGFVPNYDFERPLSGPSRTAHLDIRRGDPAEKLDSSNARSRDTFPHSQSEDDFELAARLHAAEQDEFLQVAKTLQNQLDAEDARIRRERDQLASYMQQTFHCAICMETCVEDSVARVDGCSHALCRTCMREYVSAVLKDRKFPILCPLCKAGIVADGRKRSEPSGECRSSTCTRGHVAELANQFSHRISSTRLA